MKNLKFINSNIKNWNKIKIKNGTIWHATNIKTNQLNSILDFLYNEKNININKLIVLFKNFNFNFGIVIKYKNYIIAATDIVRSYPLYFANHSNELFISPQAKNICKNKIYTVNNKQLLSYRMAGYTVGNETLWNNIRGLNSGQILFLNNGKIQINNYFDSLSNTKSSIDIELNKKNLKDHIFSIIENIKNRADGRRIVIPLSAGLDSRLIASGLKYINYNNVVCYSYGLKNNFEAKIARQICKKLNYNWTFIDISQKKAKKFYKSKFYNDYFEKCIDGCSTPGIQDIYAIKYLKDKNYFNDEDIIINGNSGDFISGGHIPLKSKNWDSELNIDNAFKIILNEQMKKHYSLWKELNTKNNNNIIKELLHKQISLQLKNKNSKIKPYVLYELLEYHNRQVKFVVNLQRIYDFCRIDWMLPLWDKEVINFWKDIPLDQKINQKLYKTTLEELNMCDVWGREFFSSNEISPKWIKPIRLFFKTAFYFSGKDKWHSFEKKYLNYWTDIICGYSMYSYKETINNNFEARNSVSWHTIASEKYLFKKNWQKN